MNWILGIDTSSTGLSIGLFRDAEPAGSYSCFRMNSHAEHIAHAVSDVLGSNGLRTADITNIAVAAGPGSFTGLRIGFSFIKGFCIAGPVMVVPVSSLFVLAHCAIGRAASAVAAIDARRNGVFWARFRIEASRVVRETADTLGTEYELRNFLKPCDAVITETLGYAHSTVFNFLAGRPNVFAADLAAVDRGLCCAAAGSAAVSDGSRWKKAADVLPEYLRSFVPSSPAKGGDAA
jgi:tRNA threonylcarbamoyladenosine biosynthesis protein TsaB